VLFVEDDWAEDHHDVEIQDETGRRLGKARLPEGIVGLARLHALIAEHIGEDAQPDQVRVGIETERGAWVSALIAAGYQTYAINPRQVARYRERHATSGAKSDVGDAHTLADMVRTDGHQLRQVAGDSAQVEGIKLLARAHQTLIWDRTRQVLRLRAGLREYFPAALLAFDDLTAPQALELLGKAPDPVTAARLSRTQILAALKRARRHPSRRGQGERDPGCAAHRAAQPNPRR
jgi:transposase